MLDAASGTTVGTATLESPEVVSSFKPEAGSTSHVGYIGATGFEPATARPPAGEATCVIFLHASPTSPPSPPSEA